MAHSCAYKTSRIVVMIFSILGVLGAILILATAGAVTDEILRQNGITGYTAAEFRSYAYMSAGIALAVYGLGLIGACAEHFWSALVYAILVVGTSIWGFTNMSMTQYPGLTIS